MTLLIADRQARCYNCGYVWSSRRETPPARCPRCQYRKWYVLPKTTPGEEKEKTP